MKGHSAYYWAFLVFIFLNLFDESTSFLTKNSILKDGIQVSRVVKPTNVLPIASTKATPTPTSSGDDSFGDASLVTSGVLGIGSWIFISYMALSRHPVAAINAAASTRHNIFTIAQALAFPVPVVASVVATLSSFTTQQEQSVQNVTRRLSLGLAVASFWTAAAVFFGPTFSVGYDLFSNPIRYVCAGLLSFQGFLGLIRWKQASGGSSFAAVVRGCVCSMFDMLSPSKKGNGEDYYDKDNAPLYAFGSLGLLVLSILPQLVGFPTATIPTLLGKRLSRSASGFTLLGSVAAFCLLKAKEEDHKKGSLDMIRRGLGIGSALHFGLVAAKLIGLDGGGLLLPGRGLWQDYPSLVKAATPATVLMMGTYLVLAIGCFSDGGRNNG